jgi:hypothetical protein
VFGFSKVSNVLLGCAVGFAPKDCSVMIENAAFILKTVIITLKNSNQNL